MVEIEYDKFSNLEELEFKFFKELDIDLLEPVKKEIEDKFNNLFSNYRTFDLLIVLKIIDNKAICKGDYQFYLFNNVLNPKEGEIICLRRYNDEIFKLEKDILDETFLDDCHNKLGDYNNLDENLKIKNNFLKKEDIEKEIEKVISETEFEKEERLKEKKEEEEKEKEGYEEKKKYENESILKLINKGIEVDKNKIINSNEKFILTKNANKIFDYGFLSGWISSGSIKGRLIEKEEEFDFYQNNKKIYKLRFEINKKEEIIKSLEEKKYYSKVKINGVRIRRDKIEFILNKISENTTKEEIKLWNKLLQIQLNLLNLKEITIKDISVNIKFSITDKNKFLVELFGKKEKLDWDIVRDIFSWGRSLNHYPSLERFIRFSENFGFTKQEVYDNLKKSKEKNET